MTSRRWKAAARFAYQARPTRDRATTIYRRFDDLSPSQLAHLQGQLEIDRFDLGARLFAAATRPLIRYLRGEITKNNREIDRIIQAKDAAEPAPSSSKAVDCRRCQGIGQIQEIDGKGRARDPSPCEMCDGTGVDANEPASRLDEAAIVPSKCDDHTASLIERIRGIACDHGWAIAVHGSLKRDIDLIAVPWTDTASSFYDLNCAIADRGGLWRGRMENKPHGRIGCIFIEAGASRIPGTENFEPPQIDLSFVDPRPIQPAETL